ncbi:hypothetical protein C2857_000317 [Epichloe festucae Fl1]|uniref:Rhodopsin domain-containing protein n=1 Tax=Epichloe festucae (strain Fl1) TaxID=877507 RepID=A0A7S9KN12_EPIFF|nr:hypothetical protein C2857_000317 [Epichloe festucae Fl1]
MAGHSNESVQWDTAVLGRIPDCATSCMGILSADRIPCPAVTDNGTVIECVLNACTAPEAIFTRNLTGVVCQQPVEDRSREFIILIITFGMVTTVITSIRLVYKLIYGRERFRLGWDDFMIVAAVPMAITGMVLMLRGLWTRGLGKSVWAVPAGDMLRYGIDLYITEILYLLALTMVKLTLTCFYMSIFPGRVTRRLLLGTIVFHVVFCTVFVVKTIFQCTPISYSWTRFDSAQAGRVRGHCVQIDASVWVHAAVNVAVDFWMIGIPLFEIRKLQLRFRKKMAVALMFMTGFLVTAISILRLGSLTKFADTSNPTHDQYGAVLWSGIEISVGILCACLPTLRLFILRMSKLAATPKGPGSPGSPGAAEAQAQAQFPSPRKPSFQHREKISADTPISTWAGAGTRTGTASVNADSVAEAEAEAGAQAEPKSVADSASEKGWPLPSEENSPRPREETDWSRALGEHETAGPLFGSQERFSILFCY